MWTGQKTLQSINQALGSANNEVSQIEQSLNQLTQQITDNRRGQTRVFQQLAAIRLDHIQSDRIRVLMDSADESAKQLLAQRQQAYSDIERQLVQIQDALQQHETIREQQATEVERASQVVIDCELSAQAALEADSSFQEQLTTTQKRDAIADRAEEKTQIAEDDRLHKGKPFEADSLFMYLWNRSYGVPEYKANPLARWLDGWVARLCRYDEARVNYWMLLELPKRLSLHAESVRTEADQALEQLQAIEQTFAQKHGVVEAQQQLSKQQEKLDGLDREQEEQEQNVTQLLNERAQFNAGEDHYYQQALNDLAKVMQRKDVYELQRLSNRTLDRQDDQLVANVIDLQDIEKELQENVREYRHLQKVRLQRARELEKVRGQFKRKRFDDIRSGFNNGSLIGVALNEFLKGVLDNRELWRTIERSQRHRDVGAWPDFGSGGLGRSSRRSNNTWHWPGGGGGGGFRLPRGGGSSSRGRGNGGFRTGGGF